MSFQSIDLHGLNLFDARMEACWALCEAFLCGNSGVRFIHGNNRGTAIQRYLRERKGVEADIRQRYPELPPLDIEPLGAGTTRIHFRKEGC